MELEEYIEYLHECNYNAIISEYNEKNELLFEIEKEIDDIQYRIRNAINDNVEYDLKLDLESKIEDKEEIERMLDFIRDKLR